MGFSRVSVLKNRTFKASLTPRATSSTPVDPRLTEVLLLSHRRRGSAGGGVQTLHRAGLDVEELGVEDHPPRLKNGFLHWMVNVG